MDETDLNPGDDAWPIMQSALSSAKIVLPTLSQGYADPRWCLDELVLMMSRPRRVMPVFYDVDSSLDRLMGRLPEYATQILNTACSVKEPRCPYCSTIPVQVIQDVSSLPFGMPGRQ